jgi:acetoin utilization protein AcuB
MDLRKLRRMPAVLAAMTPFPYAIEHDRPVSEAARMMAEHDIGHLPVTDGGVPVGVVTGRTLRVYRSEAPGRGDPPVGDAVLRDAYVVESTAPLDEVASEMARRHIDSAIVVKGGKLAGIFTATDACRYLGDLLRAWYGDRGDDDRAA